MFELTEEQKMMRDMVREFSEAEIAPIAAEIDESARFPEETVAKMSELGLLGIPIPEQYGGIGMDTLSYAIAIEEVAKVCASHALTLAAHTSLAANPILLFGTEEQKTEFLPQLASGEKLGSFCLTEPGAGSDVNNLSTFAKKIDGGFSVSGSKAFITNAGYAGIYILFAHTDTDSDGKKKSSAFIVNAGSEGITVGQKENKLGWRASDTRQVHFDDLFVPDVMKLGEIKNGFSQAMTILDAGRISIAALALGIAEASLQASLKYAKERQQFGKPLSRMQAVQFKLADMATRVHASRLMVYSAAKKKDAGQDFRLDAYMAKLFASETATAAAKDAIQIHGGYGYVKEYPVERYYRDAKGCEIGEGTSEIQRLLISRMLTE